MNFCGDMVGYMSSLPGYSVVRNASTGDVVPDRFPVGLRVMVVDDDPTCLAILDKMLRKCHYEVTRCNRAEVALSLLRENKNGYDIVLSDVHMPDMDGFKLLEHIGLEMDLSVIMMSADDSKNVVMKGVTHGACDYLIKPVRMDAIKNIWQHVIRKKKNEWRDPEQSGSLDEADKHPKQDESDYFSPANVVSWKNLKRKGEDDDGEKKDDIATLKKPRVVWSIELHQQFVSAVHHLGIDKAVPKKILEQMNVPGLTRENVASHLQKYRLYLRRVSGVSPHPGQLENSFFTRDPNFGPMALLSDLDVQTLAVAGQLPAQTIASYQVAGLGRASVKTGIAMPFAGQRIFSFESPRIKFGEGQQQQRQLYNSNAKQGNLLHGIPTTMELKQLAGLHQSLPSLASLNNINNMQGNAQSSSLNGSRLIQRVQPQSQGQMLNVGVHTNGPISIQSPGFQSSIPQAVLRSGMADSGWAIADNPISQSASMTNFSINHIPYFPGNGFPLGGAPVITSLTPLVHNTSAPGNNILNETRHHKVPDWLLQNASLNNTAASSSVQNTVNVLPSIMVHQAVSSSLQRNAQDSIRPVGNGLLSSEPNQTIDSGVQNINNVLVGNSARIKAEKSLVATNPFHDQFEQNDIMSSLLQQHQHSLEPVESELDFDAFHMDNIPV